MTTDRNRENVSGAKTANSPNAQAAHDSVTVMDDCSLVFNNSVHDGFETDEHRSASVIYHPMLFSKLCRNWLPIFHP